MVRLSECNKGSVFIYNNELVGLQYILRMIYKENQLPEIRMINGDESYNNAITTVLKQVSNDMKSNQMQQKYELKDIYSEQVIIDVTKSDIEQLDEEGYEFFIVQNKQLDGELQKLIKFIQNGGLIDATRPPKPNEPFYSYWMEVKNKAMHLRNGDQLSVKAIDRRTNNEYTIIGILIDDTCLSQRVSLLTKGNKVWKTRGNVADIQTYLILEIKKVKESPEIFNIIEVNPNYKTEEEISLFLKEYDTNSSIRQRDIEIFKTTYPNLSIDSCKILNLGYEIYFPYVDGEVIRGKVGIVNKDGTLVSLPEQKIKQIHTNKDYYSVCAIENEYLLIPFSSREEMKNIRLIFCVWEIMWDDGSTHRVLHISYPNFKEAQHKHNIFNIGAKDTIVPVHLESLDSNSVFAGKIYLSYDFVGVYANGNIIGELMGKLTKEQVTEVTKTLDAAGEGLTAEIYITEENIEATRMFSNVVGHEEHTRRMKEKLDFSRFVSS